MTGDRTETLVRRVTTPRPESVARLRDAVVAEARRHVDPELVGDVALVTSELVTNAVQHGAPGSEVVVAVSTTPGRFVVSVANEAYGRSPPSPSTWAVADPDTVQGRGLGIVRILAPEVELRSQRGRIEVEVAWPSAAAA